MGAEIADLFALFNKLRRPAILDDKCGCPLNGVDEVEAVVDSDDGISTIRGLVFEISDGADAEVGVDGEGCDWSGWA